VELNVKVKSTNQKATRGKSNKKTMQKKGGGKMTKKPEKMTRVSISGRGTTCFFKYFSFIR